MDARRRDGNDRTHVLWQKGNAPVLPPDRRAQHETQVIPQLEKEEMQFHKSKARKEPYAPGPIARWFGRAVATMFALFCCGIIGITLAFILWKYYAHLFS